MLSTSSKILVSTTDFSGTWLIDTLQSKEISKGYPTPGYIRITCNDKEVTFERKFPGHGKILEALVQDADSVEMNLGIPGYKKWSRLKFKEDQNEIEVFSSAKVDATEGSPGFSFKRKESYHLANSGNTLIWKQETAGANGVQTIQAIYKRQK